MGKEKRLATTSDNPAGSVVHTGGRAVWQWAKEKLDNTSILLKKLDNSALRLLREGELEAEQDDSPAELSLTGEPTDGGGGFDPYNSG